MKLQKVIFQKSQKLLAENLHEKAAYSEHSITIHSISMAGYVTTAPAFVSGKFKAREASNFCDFWKFTSCDFTALFSILTRENLCVLDVLDKKY